MNDMSQVKSEVSLDHTNPTPREAELIAQYNKALETVSFVATQRDTLQFQLTQAHKERDEAVAACAVMREALQHVYNWKMYLHTKVIDAGVLKQIEQALSTTCGRDLLERIKALEDENARLRRDLMDSPTDIQELVIKKLNLVSAEGPTKAEARIKALEGELKCKETEWAKIFSDLKSKATTEVALATPLIEKGRK